MWQITFDNYMMSKGLTHTVIEGYVDSMPKHNGILNAKYWSKIQLCGDNAIAVSMTVV